ncbi:MAG TPA: 4-carboxy-4-hydroxy-2-oxoadipate aldolase/oxaloacetate decarboxylase [Micromonosporaceae bacterium]|jgi:4-hydroxy-4-methyl-2-oxoglutarate aldolase|nr:4-carboxy-4-hydroxy-2-oxoadipate aldolase/oxaloacetate decarboxylase [Micromonosporaceae bacterium]
MRTVVVVGPPRADLDAVDVLGGYGVATVHEAIGRRGLLDRRLRPIRPGSRLAGTAVTALCWPGDNLMVHAAVEQCRSGDVLVVATASECHDGLFGELLATSLRARGVRGLVIQAGVRDVTALNALDFPVWATDVCAQGTVKSTAGAVNVPLALGGDVVHPGDAILADDDGVLRVAREDVAVAVEASRARAAREEEARAAFAEGQLGLDRYGLRALLHRLGVEYVRYEEYES